ncbi:MAG: dCTP deaminase [Candidatus Micrarchaeota archaeon]|nr:dCTP deaminase [Candidatus Micrarchaeota archaeon]
MFLSNEDIKKALRNKKIIIKPRPKEDQITQAGIDITLSDEFYLPKEEYFGKIIDPLTIDYTELYELKKTESIFLKPGDLVLAKTLEEITVADDIIGFMDGRSRFARLGLAVYVTSSLIQPGSKSRQILEISNLSNSVIKLTKGLRISQVLFAKLQSKTTKPYRKVGTLK